MNSDRVTKIILFSATLLIVVVAGGIIFSLAQGSVPAFKEFGLKFIFTDRWDPTEGREVYGALPFIAGTLITSFLALIICVPLAFATSLFIAEYYRGTRTDSLWPVGLLCAQTADCQPRHKRAGIRNIYIIADTCNNDNSVCYFYKY